MNIATGSAKNADNIERLRALLELEQSRPISFEEASEVAESLLCFYEALGGDSFSEDALIPRTTQ